MTPDLSLLRVFHAVMEERNVTAAAERLGQSQSTVSAALSRLREALGDELFLRARYGVEPTEKARALAPEIAAGLAQLEQAFRAAEPFEAACFPYAQHFLTSSFSRPQAIRSRDELEDAGRGYDVE